MEWQPTIPTFWVNMNQTAVLEANRGYVLALNLTESDFADAESLRLYFPSETATFMEIPTVPGISTVPGHECSSAGHESADSHWNSMGIAPYHSIDMAENGMDIFLNNEAPNFFYKWLGQTDAYEVTDGTKFVYEPFNSYMVQYADTINWANVAQAAVPASVHAQRANKVATFCINIAGAGNEDRTFIRLDDSGTKDYVINQDLLKISNGNLTQIYSLEYNYELAANVLPHREQTVMLGSIVLMMLFIRFRWQTYRKDILLYFMTDWKMYILTSRQHLMSSHKWLVVVMTVLKSVSTLN